MQIRERRFLVSTEPFYLGLWSSFVALWTTRSLAVSKSSAYLFRSVGARRFELSGKSLIGSAVLHGAAILLLLSIPHTPVATPNTTEVTFFKTEDLYYALAMLQQSKTLPRIASPGPGGRPGRGAQPKEDPKSGSSIFRTDLTVISNPIHPDNTHQTIIQPSSPPDLIIKQELKLPNLVLGNPLAKPRPPLEFFSNTLKPNATAQTKIADVAAPQPAITDPNLLASLTPPTVPEPRLPVPLAMTPGTVPAASAALTTAAGGMTGDGNPGEINGLLILGTDPTAAGASISLPPGSKYGAFSISPAGGEPGSPGGVSGGVAGVGTGGSGAGGDESTGVGSGKMGGAGGSGANEAAPINVNGPGAIAGSHGGLDALIAAGAIFPVISPPHIRRNALVISAGAVGGGGLGVYQALQCGRIYTIFVPMPTGNWTLQYCQQDASQTKSSPSANTQVIQLQEGLLAPDPVEKFDFRRVPVPAYKAQKMLVIKGIVREDGVVDNLEIYQGVLKEMDETALAALSKWKFTPAKRGGKSVAVQILVGIQLSGPVAH